MVRYDWSRIYKEHSVWGTVGIALKDLNELDDSVLDQYPRFEHAKLLLGTIEKWSENANPLVTKDMLDQLEASIRDPFLSYIQQGKQGNPSLFGQAENNVETMFIAVRGWPPTRDRLAASWQTALDQAGESLTRGNNDFEESVAQSQSNIQALMQRYEERIGERDEAADAKFKELSENSDEVARELARVSAHASTVETSLSNTLTRQQAAYQEAENRRQGLVTGQIEEAERKITAFLTSAESKDDSHRSATKEATDALMNELKLLRKQAADTVSEISTSGTGSWYREYANEQKGTADAWRFGAIILLLIAAAATFFWFLETSSDGETSQEFFVKALVSIALFSASAYAARQSAHHRDREDKARSIELKLFALDPFLATVNEEDRERMRLATASQVFLDREPGQEAEAIPTITRVGSEETPDIR